MNNRKKTALVVVGLLGLVWWWMRSKKTQADTQTDSGLDTILSKVFPQANPNGGLGDLQTLIGVAEAAAGADPKPKPDSWLWTGGQDPGKLVSLSEYLGFNKSKCTDFAGNPVSCETQGRPCTKGFDC